MGYVSEHLMQNETIVHQARVHWIVFLKAGVVLFLAFWMFAGGRELEGLATFFLMLAAVLAFASAIEMQTSEFAVTNRRVLAKTGLLRRHSLDLNLGKVESVVVEQGILGRLLDFGTIVVKGSGGTPEPFANIADPLRFRMSVQDQTEQRTRNEPIPAGSGEAIRREERECPFCAEIILAKARVCKHCGKEVPAVGM